MTTTTALLRAAVRMCAADAAFVSLDGVPDALVICGLSASAAAEVLLCARSGTALPAGRRIAWCIPIGQPESARSGKLYVLARPGKTDAALPAQAVRALASEIAAEIERSRTSDDRAAAVAATVAQLATGIEALNDAAAVIEWPGTGVPLRFLYVNGAFETLLGFRAVDAIGTPVDFLYGPLTDLERVEFMIDRVRETFAARISLVFYRRDGVPIWVEVSVRGMPATDGTVACLVATMRDVSARKEFEFALTKEKRKLQVTLAAIGDAVITTVGDGRIDYVNLATRTLLEVDAADAYGKQIADIVALKDADGMPIDVLRGAADATDGYRGQAQFERGGIRTDIGYVSSPVGDEGYVVVLRDITAQQRLSTQLSYEASHDALTGIFNRRKFYQMLYAAIASAERDGGPHALALLDLDNFKVINDTCGHPVGDRVLHDVARLLQAQLRERDLVARLGGDEFAVLLHDCSLENARRVFDNLRRAVETYRIVHAGREFAVGVSIGVTPVDGTETAAGRIVARADAACYAAKPGRREIAG